MGKYGTLGAILAVLVGFLIYFSVAFVGDVQDNALIEPANATMTVGEMRVTPHGGSGVDESDDTPQGSKGMRAQDFIVEVTNGLIESKPANTVYLIDWTFFARDAEGNISEIQDATAIVNGTENPIVIGAEYTINRYDATQVDSEGNIRDEGTPLNSTKYRWGVFTDELARTGQPLGLGGEESSVNFRLYGNNVITPSGATDYDLDGVTNTEALEDGHNPYGYLRHGDADGEVDFSEALDRYNLGE